jgi:hypothetical protein
MQPLIGCEGGHFEVYFLRLAPYPLWGLSWTYDRYGNRTAQTVTAASGPSNLVTVDATNNRITSMGSSTFDHAHDHGQ